MKPRKDLSMDPDNVILVFELSTGHILRICDWDAEPSYGGGGADVEVFENEEDFQYDDNPRVRVEARKGEAAQAETFSDYGGGSKSE